MSPPHRPLWRRSHRRSRTRSAPLDFKSALQEQLARRGETIAYEVTDEHGPPHDRTFVVVALLDGKPLGEGRGRSKKHAEQQAAGVALESLAKA